MSVLLYPTCPESCGGALPAVSFDDCAPAIHYGEVSKLYLANVEAANFTNVELLSEWTTRLSENSTDANAIREITVIGDLPEAERTEIAISGDRTIAGVKNFTMNFEIDETNGSSTNSYGVYGNSTNSIGVYGGSTNSTGVQGNSTNSIGVSGNSTNSIGVI